MTDNKTPEEYEDITFDNKDVDDISQQESEETSEEQTELKSIAVQLSEDFAKYFNFNITQEVKQLSHI